MNGNILKDNLNNELNSLFNNNKEVIEHNDFYAYELDKVYKIYKNGKIEVARLPKEYQEVEYIRASGNQYINTRILPTDYFKMELKIYTTCTNSFYCAGARTGSSTIYFGQTGTTNNSRVSCSVNGTSNTASTDGVPWKRISSGQTYEIMLCTNGDSTYTYNIKDLTNNKNFSVENTSYTPMGNVSNTIFLFALNSTYNISGTNDCYYFKLYKENELIFDGIPCYRKSDGEIGMYNMVNDEFYTNSGSGTFLKGNDV